MPKKPNRNDKKKTREDASSFIPVLSPEEVREIVAAISKAESVLMDLTEEMTVLEKECLFWCQNITNIEKEAALLEEESFLPDYNEKMEELCSRMSNALKRIEFESKNLEKFRTKYNRAAKQFGFTPIA